MMNNSQRYTVRTHWGCFSLDEGAYQDYLAGKLWISWQPEETVVRAPECVRREDVSEEAAALRDLAGRCGLWRPCRHTSPAAGCSSLIRPTWAK